MEEKKKMKIKVNGTNPLLKKKQSGLYGRARGASRSGSAVRVSGFNTVPSEGLGKGGGGR